MQLKIENNIDELILAFFSVVLFSISNLYVVNIVFFVVWISYTIRKRGFLTFENSNILYCFFAYLFWIIFDVFFVTIYRGYPMNTRNIIQLLFELQYVIWILRLEIDTKKYINFVVKIAVIYSIVIFVTFIVSGTYRHLNEIYGLYREWGENFFPSNTTSGPIPFIFALILCLYYKKGYINALIITIGGLLFPSRVSLLAMFLVWGYYIYVNAKTGIKLICLTAIIVFIISMPFLYLAITKYAPDLAYRLTVSWDRIEIFKVVKYYISKHIFTGYGGRTLNQLYDLEPLNFTILTKWPHAHNFILETFIRYGVFGALLFCSLLINMIMKIKNNKIMLFSFLLFLTMALFQTYMREFNYIFYLLILYTIGREKYDNIQIYR